MLQGITDAFSGVLNQLVAVSPATCLDTSSVSKSFVLETEDTGPVTEKESENGSAPSLRLQWGFSGMQGWRKSMEDAHFAVSDLRGVRAAAVAATSGAAHDGDDWSDTALFGVMDGHGGAQVAKFCAQHLPHKIASRSDRDLEDTLISSFEEMDQMLLDPSNLNELKDLAKGHNPIRDHPANGCGATAAVCCVRSETLVVANAGDSRVVLSRDGKAIDLSTDHKPSLQSEVERIKLAGGFVSPCLAPQGTVYRVNGGLAVSRALGDLKYKRHKDLPPQSQQICSTPEVQVIPRDAGDEFVVIACDGVWDVLSSQEVVDHIRPCLRALHAGLLQPSDIVESLLERCLSPNLRDTGGLGGDNMSAILVVLGSNEGPIDVECDLPPFVCSM